MITNMERIQDRWQKIKFYFEGSIAEWGIVAVVFLVAFASFGLGRFSALEEAQPLISILQASDAKARSFAPGGLIVASRAGSTYHYPWCAGAAQIAARNQIWFQSEQEAQKAGYVPAKNCKGLQ